MQTDTLSPGARATLELRLIDARRELTQAIERKNAAMHQADVHRAWADEASGQVRASRNAKAVNYRLDAAELEPVVRDLSARVQMLEAMLAQPAGHAAPVVLTSDQLAAVDDTHNFRAVAA